MNTLSKIGRAWICKKINISATDKDIFVKDAKAFQDRMQLLDEVYDISYMINIYKEELSKFEDEYVYNKYLEMSSENITRDIQIRVLGTMYNYARYTENIEYAREEKIVQLTPINDNSIYLRLYFDYPLYESLKYICYGVYDIPESVYEYIYNISNSRFLAYNSDINLFIENNRTIREILNDNVLKLYKSIFSLISPLYINTKELKSIDYNGVEFIASKNKQLAHINNIIEYLRSYSKLSLENIDIDLYRLEHLATNNDICRKQTFIQCNDNIMHHIDKYDTLALIKYIRRYKGEAESKYDKYTGIKYNTYDSNKHKEIQWI